MLEALRAENSKRQNTVFVLVIRGTCMFESAQTFVAAQRGHSPLSGAEPTAEFFNE